MPELTPDNSSIFDLWKLHPRGSYFLARGGDRIPPPRHVNLTLTNKCNLRCEICGSQKFLDKTKTPRMHMALETFHNIAETTFPFLTEIELNSRGEPLLYPHIMSVLDAIERHKCSFRIQHNGTLLTEAIVERIVNGYGTISLSIDAVGSLFDQVRRNAVWAKTEPGLINLTKRRDKNRVSVCFYPTLTNRTVDNMIDIVRWAHEHEVDSVNFHDYSPIDDSTEQRPSPEGKERQFDLIAAFLGAENSRLSVFDDARTIHPGRGARRTQFPSPLKAFHGPKHVNFPLDDNHPIADPQRTCAVPWQSMDIDIEGQVGVCCRAQTFPFGSAESPEAFADVWLGENYNKLRQSLLRPADGDLPLACCLPCMQHYAPETAKKMHPLLYPNNTSTHQRAFVTETAKICPILIMNESPESKAFRGCLPLGTRLSSYELFENDMKLGPQAPLEEVTALGNGRYHFSENHVYFSTSDGSHPLRNGRTYTLQRKAEALGPATFGPEDILHDDGNRYFVVVPQSWSGNNTISLWINGTKIDSSPAENIEQMTNTERSLYAIRARTFYFSIPGEMGPHAPNISVQLSLTDNTTSP